MLVPTGAKVIATTQHTVHSGANSMSRDFPDTAGQHQEPSVFQSTLPLATKLERARTELLDLSARNRLLNIPRNAKSSRSIEIVDELTTEIYGSTARSVGEFAWEPRAKAAELEHGQGDEGR